MKIYVAAVEALKKKERQDETSLPPKFCEKTSLGSQLFCFVKFSFPVKGSMHYGWSELAATNAPVADEPVEAVFRMNENPILPARILFYFSTSSLPQNFPPSYLPPPSPLLPTTYQPLPPHSIARAPETLSGSELGAWSRLGAGASLELGATASLELGAATSLELGADLERQRAWSLEPAWSGSELGAWSGNELGAWSGWSRTHARPK